MAKAKIVNNVVQLTVQALKGTLKLDLSLQRHHYRYCGTGNAIAKNSLLYFSVTDANVLADVVQVGKQMERLLKKNFRPQVLFGVQFRGNNSRRYLVDNTALNPKQFPNHFFPTSGPLVWGKMSQREFAAASAIRRVEEAINSKPSGSRGQFLKGQRLHAIIRQPGGQFNPVIRAFRGASTAFIGVSRTSLRKIGLVSGRTDLVALTLTF